MGTDRFGEAGTRAGADEADNHLDKIKLLKRLEKLPDLRFLSVEYHYLTRAEADALVDALGNMRQLRHLSLADFSGTTKDLDRLSREYMAAIGKMTQLAALELYGPVIAGDNLASLASLTKLKSLSLQYRDDGFGIHESYGCPLRHLPELPRLEALDLHGFDVDDRDLRQLAARPRLKSLGFAGTRVTDAGLAQLAPLESLEELEINDALFSDAGLKSLLTLKRLKALHIHQSYVWLTDDLLESGQPTTLTLDDGEDIFVPGPKLDGWRRRLKALRAANPAIVIDQHGLTAFRERETSPRSDPQLLPDRFWGQWGTGSLQWLTTPPGKPEAVERLKGLKW